MKVAFFFILTLFMQGAFAIGDCDVRVGVTSGVKVLEFVTDNVVHSKMSLSDFSQRAVREELMNLQDMGICTEKIIKKNCILKSAKKGKGSIVTLIRGKDSWLSWPMKAKKNAQEFVQQLKRLGHCS